MPMRTGCKNYQSRTYRNGEVARYCALDLAPEAPWRCPADCHAFEPRLADVGWSHGSLISKPTPDEPTNLEGVGALLDEAEDIINRVGPEVLADLDRERQESKPLVERLKGKFRRGRRS